MFAATPTPHSLQEYSKSLSVLGLGDLQNEFSAQGKLKRVLPSDSELWRWIVVKGLDPAFPLFQVHGEGLLLALRELARVGSRGRAGV